MSSIGKKKTSCTRRAIRLGAGVFGSMLHRVAGQIRRVVLSTIDTDPTNIAVLCDAFLRYGSAQARALQESGLTVTLYYVDRVDEFAGNELDRAEVLECAEAAGVGLVPLPRRRIRLLVSHTHWLHRDLRRRNIATAIVHAHIDPRYATLGFGQRVALVIHDPQPHSGDTMSIFPLPVRAISRFAEITASCLFVHSDKLLDQVHPLLRRLPIGVVAHGAEMAPAPLPSP